VASLDGDEEVLRSQAAYYREQAPDYLRQAHQLDGWRELQQAVTRFRPVGDVLELACGPGTWTAQLLESATEVTAVDGSAEMLAIARSRVGENRVTFVQADLFSWQPTRRYNAVFFGFWLSHVPLPRFEQFWRLVDDCLAPGGQVLFVDDSYRPLAELAGGSSSSVVTRRTASGAEHRLVKVPYDPLELQERLASLGWDVEVRPIADHLYWGRGQRLH
jgi:ubiquinone/menaquinone biosynthesis C-methylase UbiE